VKLYAPAKINLSLRILAREESGFHQLETVFCALDLHDLLELTPGAEGLRLIVHGPDLGPPAQNLVIRAASLFYQTVGMEPALELRLRKNIPPGSGLGGGSSDAAATLHGLNALHGLPVREAGLLEMAISLGSDVPFFLAGSSLALAWGRGERLLALPPLEPAPVLLAVPPFAVNTPDAYAALAADRVTAPAPRASAVQRMEELSGWDGIAKRAHNDFEQVMFVQYPVLAEVRDAVRDAGARLALLTGSGSCVFGVFRDAAARDAAAARLQEQFDGLRTIPAWTAHEHSPSVVI
jgi:4-diphosphocytidyl-2-C-methyl-D-erythritol kinase